MKNITVTFDRKAEKQLSKLPEVTLEKFRRQLNGYSQTKNILLFVLKRCVVRISGKHELIGSIDLRSL